ncbi:hypothetical protein R6Q57_014265 [Mikania cordata]
MIGRKAYVCGFLSPPSNPRLNYRQTVKTTKLEYGRGSENSRLSRGMHRDRKEPYQGSPSRKRWILDIVCIDLCSVVANTLNVTPGQPKAKP